MIPYKLPYVMDDVECLHHALYQLLDARELMFVSEYTLAIDDYFSFQDVTLQVLAVESIIQNIPDVGVFFRFPTP
jgi:hypothetical protein